MMLGGSVSAQDAQPKEREVVSTYCESLRKLSKDVYSKSSYGVKLNPYLYRLISPSVFYSEPANENLAIDWKSSLANTEEDDTDAKISSSMNSLLFNAYISSPKVLTNHVSEVINETLVKKESVDEKKTEKVLENVLLSNTNLDVMDDVEEDVQIEVTRPNFWNTSCVFTSQFTQNYFSDNWYKGGNNNATMLSTLTLKANYNDQKRITWENTLEMRLGFVTTTDDTCHNYIANNDRLRLWSKLGVKAKKNWSYTTTLEATTQFLPSYRSNDRRVYADFLAPLDVYLSVGMDYRPKFKNGNTLSIALLPLSYKMRYIGSSDENIHNATNMKNRDKREDFGGKFELLSSVNIVKDLTWNCRLTAFTSYEYVEAELENKLRYKLTKYISSELYTLWRFDDNRPRHLFDDNLGYFQFREYLTFGLTYDF
jgi:hypothetical protein